MRSMRAETSWTQMTLQSASQTSPRVSDQEKQPPLSKALEEQQVGKHNRREIE